MCTRRPFGSMALVIAAYMMWPSLAHPCATAPTVGEYIFVNHEEALIVWDESRHIEHFVRTAVFESSARSFGFLVPTPGRPILAAANNEALTELEGLTRPETVTVGHVELDPTLSLVSYCLGDLDLGVSAPAPVHVLEESRVAGLDATVVAASDANALADWLQHRGFEQRDALKRWLATYIARGWYVTTFRYEASAADPPNDAHPLSQEGLGRDRRLSVTSQAVRISFPTMEPVYPYLEPVDVPDVPHRILNLFVIASQRMDATLLGESLNPWSAKVVFAADVPLKLFDGPLAKKLAGVDLPAHAWITQYVDLASKRVASDIVFRPSASPQEVRPAPIVQPIRTPIPVPYELLPVGFAGVWWWRRRRQALQRSEGAKMMRSTG
jgi:hypothetical protein